MNARLFFCGFCLVLAGACKKDDDVKDFRLQGEWEQHFSSAPMEMLTGSVAFQGGGAFYFGLGDDSEMPVDLLYRFHPKSGWTVMERFPGKRREGAVGFVLGKKVYVGLGINAEFGLHWGEPLRDFWVYDGQTGVWEELQAEFPGGGRWGAVAFVKDGKAYVGTGEGEEELTGMKSYGDFYAFSPESGWEQVKGLTVNGRMDATVFEADGDIYLCFGKSKGEVRRDVYRLAADASSWETMRSVTPEKIPNIPNRASSFVLNRGGRDYAFVYYTTRGVVGCMYVPEEDRWEAVADLPWSYAYFTIDNELYRLEGLQTFRLVEN